MARRPRSYGAISRRGVTLVELLITVLIISLVAAAGAATWSLSSRAPGTMRRTEMGAQLATREIEYIKAQKYSGTTVGSTTRWYDKNGALLQTGGNAPGGAVYLATTTVGAPAGITLTGSSSDLLQATAVITDVAGAVTYETQLALITFGGM